MLSRRLSNSHQLLKPKNTRNLLTVDHWKRVEDEKNGKRVEGENKGKQGQGENNGKRVEGQNNMKKHFDPISLAPSSMHSEFDSKRIFSFPVDPKSNPNDYAPCEFVSGDYSRAGMRTIEYSCVDKKEEPYSPPGGEHRYGGIKRYEWSVEKMLERG